MTSKLIEGFLKFYKKAYHGEDALMPRLVEDGQNPEYFFISCIDSRSNPATVFHAQPGLFFAHKAMGAIVRPYQKGTALSAALQFAIHHNKVKHVIVMGHTGCGAVKALVNNIRDEEIASFVDVAQLGVSRALGRIVEKKTSNDLQRESEEQIILQSMENLKSYPAVREALAAGKLDITGWLFVMETGDLLEYDSAAGEFVDISSQETGKK